MVSISAGFPEFSKVSATSAPSGIPAFRSFRELEPWFLAVKALPSDTMSDFFIVCILTGLRREEALSLKWTSIDLIGNKLEITGAETKNHQTHVLPLSDYLADLFRRRKESYSTKSPWVLPGAEPEKHLAEPKRAVKTVTDRSSVKFMIHDLRRTFLTVGASLDISQKKLKRLANHRDGDVTSGYIKLTVDSLREPMQKITDYILSQAGVKQAQVQTPDIEV